MGGMRFGAQPALPRIAATSPAQAANCFIEYDMWFPTANVIQTPEWREFAAVTRLTS